MDVMIVWNEYYIARDKIIYLYMQDFGNKYISIQLLHVIIYYNEIVILMLIISMQVIINKRRRWGI